MTKCPHVETAGGESSNCQTGELLSVGWVWQMDTDGAEVV